MVNFATVSLAALATLVPLAVADNCQNGLLYCGYNLLKRGNYYTQINEALLSNGQPTDSNHINYSFFRCLGGSNGAIEFLNYCPDCHDGGSDHSDKC
ncbi:hypothetical protein NOR_05130 [Metarhizium rileyi]|uniref:Uncharacterized protein n=1 Tax=Metarhizium rileyi (strain RCEF 4871) TaxID=1649241 RepID=A0A167DEE9_METRR|nr:hypothetical protein NOR_05130 [Metarhizium rileyi RCEF 4871]TWU72444.1 hypothetical protein ED733_003598 [Metarhizium rileyi]